VNREESKNPAQNRWVKFTLFKLDSAWRRLPSNERERGRAEFADAIERHMPTIEIYSYSTLGLKADADLLLWNWSPSPDALQEMFAQLLLTGLGQYLTISHSLLGLLRPSIYVRKPTTQEQAADEKERARYLVVYPFSKTIDWYLMSKEARQGMMNEHIRIGHEYPSVRQVLAYSTGLDDQEFVVVYETDKLEDFQDLVIALRSTEARRYTLSDTPIFTAIYRPLEETLKLLG
jgi:chlorite dismutase